MKLKEKGQIIVDILKQHYPDTCSLVAEKDYELLFSTRLAAQCTDARVNEVTKVLYSRFPTINALADADYDEICEIIPSAKSASSLPVFGNFFAERIAGTFAGIRFFSLSSGIACSSRTTSVHDGRSCAYLRSIRLISNDMAGGMSGTI